MINPSPNHTLITRLFPLIGIAIALIIFFLLAGNIFENVDANGASLPRTSLTLLAW